MSEPQVVINQEALPHSVELSTNSKGKVSATVKVYAADPMDAAMRTLEVLDYVNAELRGRGVLAE